MYSKQEASILTQQFWTTLGQYLAPILSAEGEKINWVNYKTGEKDIRFVMTANSKIAKIAIQLSHKAAAIQQQYFEKMLQHRKIIQHITGEEWVWQPFITDCYGKIVSEIFITIENVNVYNKQDWPAIISFLKPRMIALDQFWCEFKYAFEKD